MHRTPVAPPTKRHPNRKKEISRLGARGRCIQFSKWVPIVPSVMSSFMKGGLVANLLGLGMQCDKCHNHPFDLLKARLASCKAACSCFVHAETLTTFPIKGRSAPLFFIKNFRFYTPLLLT